MTHDERVFYHTYTTCEGIAEHAERIVRLEELCANLLEELHFCVENQGLLALYDWPLALEEEAKELGIEVEL